MSGPSVKIITNSKGSGDWVVVEMDGEVVHEAHDITPSDLYEIMRQTYGFEYISFIEVTDQQMEEGKYDAD